MYIGCSSHVIKRIGEHQSNGYKNGKFNRVLLIPTIPDHRDLIERYLIAYFNPPLNSDNLLNYKPSWREVQKWIDDEIDHEMLTSANQ